MMVEDIIYSFESIELQKFLNLISVNSKASTHQFLAIKSKPTRTHTFCAIELTPGISDIHAIISFVVCDCKLTVISLLWHLKNGTAFMSNMYSTSISEVFPWLRLIRNFSPKNKNLEAIPLCQER